MHCAPCCTVHRCTVYTILRIGLQIPKVLNSPKLWHGGVLPAAVWVRVPPDVGAGPGADILVAVLEAVGPLIVVVCVAILSHRNLKYRDCETLSLTFSGGINYDGRIFELCIILQLHYCSKGELQSITQMWFKYHTDMVLVSNRSNTSITRT